MREVLDRLERKMDQFLSAISLKADREDVLHLSTRLGTAETRLTELEQYHMNEAVQKKQRSEHRRWLWPTIAGFLAAVAALLGALAAFHV